MLSCMCAVWDCVPRGVAQTRRRRWDVQCTSSRYRCRACDARDTNSIMLNPTLPPPTTNPHPPHILNSYASPSTGPKTVFFWAPLMKWCLVAAGLKDLTRPAEKLSVSQNVGACCLLHPIYSTRFLCAMLIIVHFIYSPPTHPPSLLSQSSHSTHPPHSQPTPSTPTALTATGFIWVRYSLVITPVNYSLAASTSSSGLRGWVSSLGFGSTYLCLL